MTMHLPRRAALFAGAALLASRRAGAADLVPIGVLLTAGAPSAPAVRAGLRAAMADIAAGGGLLGGRPIALVEADDRDDPFAAIAAARHLVEREGVAAIIGPLRSGLLPAVAKTVTIPAGVALVAPGAPAPALAALNDGDTVFRTAVPDGLAARVLARLAREAGIARVAILAANAPAERGFATFFAAVFAARGGSVTGNLPFEPARASYRAELHAVAARGTPEALLVAGDAARGGALLLREAAESGLFPRLLASGGLRDEAALGGAAGLQRLEGLLGVAPAASRAPERKAAFAAVLARVEADMPPDAPLAAEAHDALMVLALAIEAGRSPSREVIAAGLRDVSAAPGVEIGPGEFGRARAAIARGEAVNYEGASGPVEFDAAGDARGQVEHWTIRAGRITTLGLLAA